jgi:hypothetical protein
MNNKYNNNNNNKNNDAPIDVQKLQERQHFEWCCKVFRPHPKLTSSNLL